MILNLPRSTSSSSQILVPKHSNNQISKTPKHSKKAQEEGEELMFDSNDIRSLGSQVQLQQLAQVQLDLAEDTNHAELETIRCLIRLVRHLYSIRKVQLQVEGTTAFHGYPSVEDKNPILEYAWKRYLPFDLAGQIYHLKEKFGQCHNVVEMINSDLMKETLWDRPEFRLHNATAGGVRDFAAEAIQNAKNCEWADHMSLEQAVHLGVGFHTCLTEDSSVVGTNEPEMIRVTVTGTNLRRLPVTLFLDDGPALADDYQHVVHSEDTIYILIATVIVKCGAPMPELTLYNPNDALMNHRRVIYDGSESTCLLLYGKFGKSQIFPGGAVDRILNAEAAAASSSDGDHVMQDFMEDLARRAAAGTSSFPPFHVQPAKRFRRVQ